MSLREDLRRHVARLGLEREYLTDVSSHLQLTMASQMLNVVEAAMVDCGVPDGTRQQVLERVVYGSTPSRAEVQQRQQLLDQQGQLLQRGHQTGMRWDDDLKCWLGGGGGSPGGGSGTAAVSNGR